MMVLMKELRMKLGVSNRVSQNSSQQPVQSSELMGIKHARLAVSTRRRGLCLRNSHGKAAGGGQLDVKSLFAGRLLTRSSKERACRSVMASRSSHEAPSFLRKAKPGSLELVGYRHETSNLDDRHSHTYPL